MKYGPSVYEGEEKKKRQQHCTYCTNHGKKSRKTNHKCKYENCECLLCKLTRLSRLIMRHQQRLWRHLKDTKRRQDASMDQQQGGSGSPMAPGGQSSASAGSTKQQKCDMCRNHGLITSKRAHKNECPRQNCKCALCSLTRKRRDIMRHQQRVRRSQVMSRQHNEAWDYVIKAEREFQKMEDGQSMDENNEAYSSASPSPSPNKSGEGSPTAAVSYHFTPLKSEVLSPNPASHQAQPTRNAKKPMPEMPPLELLPECSPPRYSPVHALPPAIASTRPVTPPDPVSPPIITVKEVPVGNTEATWKNLKKEREDILKCSPKIPDREGNLLSNLDFMRGHQTATGRLEPSIPMEGLNFHGSTTTTTPMEYTTSHMAPFKSLMSMIDSNQLPPTQLKKMRMDENLHFQYSPMFWGNFPVEPRHGFVPEDLHAHHYQRAIASASNELRMRSPPGLIPIHHQQHPLRPRPLTPLRPHSLHSSMDWNVNLHPLAYFLNRGNHYCDTLPTPPPFVLPREAFLHPPVP